MPDPLSMQDLQRREFLRWLAATPFLTMLGGFGLGEVEELIAQEAPRRSLDSLVASAQEALDVFDFEKVAAATIPTAHWGYIKTGVDGETTQVNNRAALERIYIRARRLINVSTRTNSKGFGLN